MSPKKRLEAIVHLMRLMSALAKTKNTFISKVCTDNPKMCRDAKLKRKASKDQAGPEKKKAKETIQVCHGLRAHIMALLGS